MSARTPSFYWYDFETTGIDTRRDRPLQFAGLRTDMDLRPIEEPIVLYCRPPADVLPAPAACAITGIGPVTAAERGVSEAEFAAAVLEELGRAGTCALGYNTLRFDDEVTRHLLWRNLYDPYAREWRNGNSRWDMIDVFRLARALRPDGLEWPEREPGIPSFRLEDLAAANGIEHDAHDALADVYATIELTRRLRAAQPKLFEYAFTHRDKRSAGDLLRLDAAEPVLHVSDKYPSARGAIAPVAALAPHPWIGNQVLVVDLASDPAPLLDLDADALAERLFRPASERAEGEPPIPVKTVKLNAAPVLAPSGTLAPEAAGRLGIDVDAARATLKRLRGDAGLADRLRAAFDRGEAAPGDPDTALYDGFVSDDDRARMDGIHRRDPASLTGFDPGFTDPRLREIYFRYRARNWPDTLDADEQARWRELRGRRLCRGEAGSPRSLAEFDPALAADRENGRLDEAMHAELTDWRERLLADLPVCGDPADV